MSRARVTLRGAALLLALLGSGCGGLFHSNVQPDQTYYLRAAPAAGEAAHAMPERGAPSLRVTRPQAGPGLDTWRIVLVQPDHRMDFYAASRWPAPAPQLLEALVVETLRASGTFGSVEDSTSPFPSDYLLTLTVHRFEAEYRAANAAPEVHVVLDCTIGRREGREVLSTFVASGNATAAANRLGEVVAAFEEATGRALGALAQQAAQAVERASDRSAQNAEKPLPSSSRDSQ